MTDLEIVELAARRVAAKATSNGYDDIFGFFLAFAESIQNSARERESGMPREESPVNPG